MQELASGVEALRRARASDVETTAQVQATLQRTISASSSMEYRLEQTAEEQRKAREAAEEARRASAMALERAAQLQKEQERTSQQIEQTVTAQAMEAQKTIQGATQVAVQTQREVQGLSDMARKAEYTAQLTASKVEKQAEDIARQVQEQKEQSRKEARAIQSAQEKMAQQLDEAQKAVQSTVSLSQYYEKQLDAVTSKMAKMEKLLMTQTQRSTTLEGQLSAAQDRIGGAERRAKLLEDENVRIHSELEYWNELYSQETGATPPQIGQEVNSPPSVVTSAPPAVSTSVSSLIMGYENVASGSGPISSAMSTPQTTSILSSPSMVLGNIGTFDPAGNFTPYEAANVNSSVGFGSWDLPPITRQQSGRRESFGSVFPGSSGTGGNGNGSGNIGMTGVPPRNRMTQPATFNIGIKPKEPPVFNGRANEDIDTWLAKVGDFIYLTEANERQQVAYMATLLQEAAADWWTALLKERHGSRPADFLEMSVLLQKRFGSTTRVDRARAALRNIKQGQSESVRSFSTRFEALLAKLPTFDKDWAKTQYIWGLHQKVAELVVIAEPGDLHAAIHQAEKIEMARGTVSGNTQNQTSGSWNRGRGRFTRGRGRFNAVQQSPGQNSQAQGSNTQSFAAGQMQGQKQYPPIGYNQCSRCKGWGHWSYECPSPQQGNFRGGRGGRFTRGRAMRGRRGGRNIQRGRGRNTSVNASLTASGSGAPAPQPQVQDAAPVPVPPRPGN